MLVILTSTGGENVMVNTDNILFATEDDYGTRIFFRDTKKVLAVKETVVGIIRQAERQLQSECRLTNKVLATFGAYPNSRLIHRRGL